jgi:hypothetical protein
MQVRPGDPAALAHQSDPLSRSHQLSQVNVCPAQVKVGCHQPGSVIDVNSPPGQIKIRN